MKNIPKPWLLLTAASLALNLFCLGAWAGRHFMARERGPYGSRLGIHTFLRHSGLGDAGPEVTQIMRSQRGTMVDHMHEIGDARKQVRAALQARPFDRSQLEHALGTLEARMSGMQHDMHAALIKVAGAVDDTHRAHMADALWPRPRFGRGGPQP